MGKTPCWSPLWCGSEDRANSSTLTHPSLSVPLSSKESIENCRSLPSESLGEFGKDNPASANPCVRSPIDHRFGRAGGVVEISGSEDKCMLWRYVPERFGVDVLRGIKLCGLLLRPSFGGEVLALFSSRNLSKLPVELAGVWDDKLREGEGLTGEADDRRLLSLALEAPILGKQIPI